MPMKLRTLVVAALSLLLLAPVALMAGPVVETFSERADGTFDPAAQVAAKAALQSRLASQAVAAKVGVPLQLRFTQEELAEVDRNSPAERRVQVGLVKEIGMAVDFADLAGRKLSAVGEPRFFGAVKAAGDGFVWTGHVLSNDATGIRLSFTEVNLPKGVELYLYNDAGQAFGPYTGQGPRGNGEFWSPTIFGAKLIAQLHFDRPMDAAVLGATHFVVEEAGHLTDRFLLPGTLSKPDFSAGLKAFCSFNASCVENANCGSTSSAVNDSRDGVAHILYRSGGGFFICSGGLLADTDSSSQIPYFLTANHCLSKGREASSMQAFWQFDTPCGGSCYNPSGAVPSTTGASIRATNRTGDYTLLELDQAPPAGSVFLGWTNSPVANSNGTNLFRISHPRGAPQAYSEHRVDTSAGTCTSWPRGERIYSRDLYGATEGGSSGSPVVNSAGQVVGQLSGACGTNVNNSCDPSSNATVDGALAAYFSEVEPFLDPSGGPGGGCTLGQVGDSCTSGGDCCSGSCKGKPGSKTCK